MRGAATAREYNETTYDRLWRHAHVQPPQRMPWWPVVEGLAAERRLEIGPGAYPKLPIAGTDMVDLSGHALSMLAAEGATVHRGLLHEVGFGDATFDLVGAFEVLEHVDGDEELLREIARVTRPGGHMILSVPMAMRYYTIFDKFAGHVRRYEPGELESKLAKAGFRISRFEVRRGELGKVSGAILAVICDAWPRLAVWITERLVLPAVAKVVLHWFDGAEWRTRAKDAAMCSVVCERV